MSDVTERLKQEAMVTEYSHGCWGETESYQVLDPDKLIELVVKECTGVVMGGSFLHEEAPTAIFAREIRGAIKRHFGVE